MGEKIDAPTLDGDVPDLMKVLEVVVPREARKQLGGYHIQSFNTFITRHRIALICLKGNGCN